MFNQTESYIDLYTAPAERMLRYEPSATIEPHTNIIHGVILPDDVNVWP